MKISCFVFYNLLCNLCNLQLDSEVGLTEHYRDIHEPLQVKDADGVLQYMCKVCQKQQFKRYPSAVNHCKVKQKEPYYCPDCGKEILHKNNIQRHKQRCNGENSFMCSKCNKIIKTKFETHILSCKVKRDPTKRLLPKD